MLDKSNHGGDIIYGGSSDVKERYIEPTIITDPKLDSQLMQEEIFGPIMPVIKFTDIDYVIQFINERPKPLALYYYGKNK
jgi:aldehyde dehydrogenase (NAD+)